MNNEVLFPKKINCLKLSVPREALALSDSPCIAEYILNLIFDR